jgi:hypothetical protein
VTPRDAMDRGVRRLANPNSTGPSFLAALLTLVLTRLEIVNLR